MTFEEAQKLIAGLSIADIHVVKHACDHAIYGEPKALDLTQEEREMLARNDILGAVKSVRWRLNIPLLDARNFVEKRR